MIGIHNKADCCGCGACVQKCPKHCISFDEDSEGFYYPTIDEQSCIDCGMCEKTCPVSSPYNKRKPIRTFAAINKDERIRLESSSGGFFSVMAQQIIANGGVVFGARFDEKWNVIIDSCDTIEKLSEFRGSKYVQAYTGDAFKRCEQLLKSNVKVLFSGTPCQISALKHFLSHDYDNLITVDFICHGVPSPKVWKMYLNEISKLSEIDSISMRNKDKGWADYNMKIGLNSNGSQVISSSHRDNIYMKAFLNDMILRPSCYNCKAKECRSSSDITIGDFWGVEKICPELNDDRGINICLLHTNKCDNLLYGHNIYIDDVAYEDVVKYNQSILKSVSPWPRRKEFFDKLSKTNSIESLMAQCLTPKFDYKNFVRIKVGTAIKVFHRLFD